MAPTGPRDAQVTGYLSCYFCDHAAETARPRLGSSMRICIVHWPQGVVPDALADMIFRLGLGLSFLVDETVFLHCRLPFGIALCLHNNNFSLLSSPLDRSWSMWFSPWECFGLLFLLGHCLFCGRPLCHCYFPTGTCICHSDVHLGTCLCCLPAG